MRALLAVAAAVLLGGCATPSNRADNPDNFKQMAAGNVGAANAQPMVDCVDDGFTRILGGGTNIAVKQTRRTALTRVEMVVGAYLVLSADIADTGATQLLENKAAAGIRTSKEIAEYKACLARFAAK